LLAHTGEYLWTKTVIVYTDPNKPDKEIPTAQYLPSPGSPGADGANGPMLVGRGKYNCDEQGYLDPQGADQVYVGNDKIRNVVWYDNGVAGRWYMTLDVRSITNEGGTFSGIAPDDPATAQHPAGTAYWAAFEGTFTNIATGLLFAQKAFIENAVVRFLETSLDNSSARIEAAENWFKMYDDNGLQRLEITGDEIDLASAAVSYPTSGASFYHAYQGTDASGNGSDYFYVCQFATPGSNNAYYSVDIPDIDICMEETYLYDGYIEITGYTIAIMDGNSVVYTLRTYTGRTSPADIHINGASYSLRGGKEFTIKASFSWYWRAWYDQGSYALIDNVSIRIYDDSHANVIVYNNTENMVRIGSNGIAINLINSFSAIFGVEENNGVRSSVIKLEGIYGSNQVGIRITETDGLQINTGSGWTTPLTS
jgi:hypothetical protein